MYMLFVLTFGDLYNYLNIIFLFECVVTCQNTGHGILFINDS